MGAFLAGCQGSVTSTTAAATPGTNPNPTPNPTPNPSPTPAPTVSLSASPSSIANGGSSTLSWSSTNATGCTAAGAWSGSKSTSGSQSSGALSSSQTYTLTCTGAGGSASRSATVTVAGGPPPVPAPTVSLSASPTSVAIGGSSTLSWSAANATACTASGAWAGTKSTSGSQSTGSLGSSQTFTLTCTGAGGSASNSVLVLVGNNSTVCDVVGYSTEKNNLTAPYCLDMQDNDYLSYPNGNPVAIANGNAQVTDEPTGSYAGRHSAKVVPPTSESYAGLGNFNFRSGSVGNRMNIRYLVYWGYDTVQSGVKLNIMNDGVSTRPMVISREMRAGSNTTYPHSYMIPIPSQNVNEAPTIRDPGYPNNPSFFISNSSAPLADGNYAHQWVSWEFEIITGGSSPILNFYIHTRDGRVAFGPGNPYATHAWNAGAIDLVRASVGWYWGPNWRQSAESYVKISDVVISNSYIGPPPGFVQ